MSLVAYDSSGESEEETSVTGESGVPVKNIINIPVKRNRKSVKITIPSLKEFEEEEKEEPPKKKPNYKPGSGLFSILPPPKNSAVLTKPGFMPHVLKSKTDKSVSPSVVIKNPVKSVTSTLLSKSAENEDSDEDSTTETKAKFCNTGSTPSFDFFSLDSTTETVSKHSNDLSTYESDTSVPPVIGRSFTQNVLNEPLENSSPTVLSVVKNELVGLQEPLTDIYQNEESYVPEQSPDQYSGESSMAPNPVDALLNDEGFRKLQGKRREFEGLNFIDVNAADQVSDKNEWLIKSLTEESTYRPSRKKHNMPTSQQRRKHQITYLAFQAKEREMDLKNQWALNSRTRRETQAKYGF